MTFSVDVAPLVSSLYRSQAIPKLASCIEVGGNDEFSLFIHISELSTHLNPKETVFDLGLQDKAEKKPVIDPVRNETLNILRDLMATGKVTPVIDRQYSLNDLPEAIRYVETGHARGKVVITFD